MKSTHVQRILSILLYRGANYPLCNRHWSKRLSSFRVGFVSSVAMSHQILVWISTINMCNWGTQHWGLCLTIFESTQNISNATVASASVDPHQKWRYIKFFLRLRLTLFQVDRAVLIFWNIRRWTSRRAHIVRAHIHPHRSRRTWSAPPTTWEARNETPARYDSYLHIRCFEWSMIMLPNRISSNRLNIFNQTKWDIDGDLIVELFALAWCPIIRQFLILPTLSWSGFQFVKDIVFLVFFSLV